MNNAISPPPPARVGAAVSAFSFKLVRRSALLVFGLVMAAIFAPSVALAQTPTDFTITQQAGSFDLDMTWSITTYSGPAWLLEIRSGTGDDARCTAIQRPIATDADGGSNSPHMFSSVFRATNWGGTRGACMGDSPPAQHETQALVVGTEYNFRIGPRSGGGLIGGTSFTSDVAVTIAARTAPPVNPMATTGDGSITVSVTRPEEGGGFTRPNRYQVCVGRVSGSGNTVANFFGRCDTNPTTVSRFSLDSNPTQTHSSVINNNIEYYVAVRSYDTGTTIYSPWVATTPATVTPMIPAEPDDATLSNLQIDGTAISGFARNTMEYAVSVAHDTATVTVAATTRNPAATVTSITADNTVAAGVVTLNAAGTTTTITVLVTAMDGAATETYVVTVTRLGPPVTITLSIAPPASGGTTYYEGYDNIVITVTADSAPAADLPVTLRIEGGGVGRFLDQNVSGDARHQQVATIPAGETSVEATFVIAENAGVQADTDELGASVTVVDGAGYTFDTTTRPSFTVSDGEPAATTPTPSSDATLSALFA